MKFGGEETKVVRCSTSLVLVKLGGRYNAILVSAYDCFPIVAAMNTLGKFDPLKCKKKCFESLLFDLDLF